MCSNFLMLEKIIYLNLKTFLFDKTKLQILLNILYKKLLAILLLKTKSIILNNKF